MSNELAGIMDWCLLMTKFGDDWLSRSWDFVKFPYKQTDRQTRPTNILAKITFWQVTNTTNEHTCQNVILASNERAIGDCLLAKICQYNAHCNGDSDKWNIVDYIHVWLVWKSIGLHVLAFWQVGWIRIHLLYPSHFDVTLWHYKWRHQHQKYFFGVNFGQSFHI